MKILLSLLSLMMPLSEPAILRDTLQEVFVSASVKQIGAIDTVVSPVSTFNMRDISRYGISSAKDVSASVPNLWMPQYGSSMTSSIYLRGFGSRMDNPVMAVYADDVPIVDKNSYDFDFIDIRRVDVLRGPQATLYGRNSMMGVINVRTLSPLDWQGVKARLEVGSYGLRKASASVYGSKWGFSAGYRHQDGYYTNQYDGRNLDFHDGFSARLRYAAKTRSGAIYENTLSLSNIEEGAFPYSQFVSGILLPVSYNHPGRYHRLNVTDAATIRKKGSVLDFNSATSIQILSDKMNMDQDYTTADLFTMEQKQTQFALTHDMNFRPINHPSWWDSQTGVFVMAKYNKMDVPVIFGQDGISDVILGPANARIPSYIGHLAFKENNLPIVSDFKIFTGNAAVYHESYWYLNKFKFVTGLRFDYEFNHMDYHSNALVHYRLVPFMPHYGKVNSIYDGSLHNDYFQVIPKLAVSYKLGGDNSSAEIFGVVSTGYKTGGFNTNIFADIVQEKMMNEMKSDFLMPSGNETDPSVMSYKPEKSTDYEIGFKYSRSGDIQFSTGLTVFYIDCHDQQVTVLPEGGLGRVMANIGHSYSRGFEAAASLKWKGLMLEADYGYSDISQVGGGEIPYAPHNTMRAAAGYAFSNISDRIGAIEFGVDMKGAGKIYWNEAGTISQPYYSLLGAYASMNMGRFRFTLRGENLTDNDYNVFYFESLSREFYQKGLPARMSFSVEMNF